MTKNMPLAAITHPDVLARLRLQLDEDVLVIEHRFFPNERKLHRFICETFEQLEGYLKEHAKVGDTFTFWSFFGACRRDNAIEVGKVP